MSSSFQSVQATEIPASCCSDPAQKLFSVCSVVHNVFRNTLAAEWHFLLLHNHSKPGTVWMHCIHFVLIYPSRKWHTAFLETGVVADFCRGAVLAVLRHRFLFIWSSGISRNVSLGLHHALLEIWAIALKVFAVGWELKTLAWIMKEAFDQLFS